MKNNKTKTIILLFKILDNCMNRLIAQNLSETEEQKVLYKYNSIEYLLNELFREYLGERLNYYKRRENLVEYDYLEVLKNLTPFQQECFTRWERESKILYLSHIIKRREEKIKKFRKENIKYYFIF